ncbi:MAG: glycosyltransferase family 39 protein [Thermoleophilaceae bacterium]|nr:glycosyltransferase family 39 protein [Thermoleophilaceae bacterium]
MRRHLPAILAVVAVPLLLFAVYGAPYLNYDASYSLVWAHDIAHGYTPDYNGFIAPTPHPLQTFVSFLALPLGSSAYGFMAWVIMFAFGGLIWVIYRLGSELFNRPVGLVAAAVIATRPAFDKNALAAYQDVPFVMFVLAALLLEVQRPRRGWPVLALLTLAGLLRPEGWVLAGLYFLYLAPKLNWNKRFVLGALAVAGPVLWALSDWAITGDPLHSFHGTKDLASQLDRPRSFGEAPGWTARFFGFTLREPLMIGVPIGIAFAWIYARRAALILLGVAGLMTAMFIGSTLVGLPLIARYVLTPAALLAIFYGAACFGWLNIDQLGPRKGWRVVGLVTLLLSVLFIPKHILLIDEMRTKIDNYATIQGDLRVVSESPKFRAFYARCGRVSTTDHRPVPAFRFWVGGPPGSVQSAADVPAHPWAQTAIFPRSLDVAKKFYNRAPSLTPPPRMHYEQVLLTKHWRLLATPQCRAAVASRRTLPAVDRS